LKADVGETANITSQHSEAVARIAAYLDRARTESPDWPA
jgi:hypothetical protein